MSVFHLAPKWLLLLLSLLFSLLLLLSQGATLHVHNLHHQHATDVHSDGSAIHGSAIHSPTVHSHVRKAHSAYHQSHHEHHHDVVLEFEVIPDGVLKNLADNFFIFVLFVSLFSLLLFAPLLRVAQYYRENKSILYGHYLISPPLRAPPQYS